MKTQASALKFSRSGGKKGVLSGVSPRAGQENGNGGDGGKGHP